MSTKHLVFVAFVFLCVPLVPEAQKPPKPSGTAPNPAIAYEGWKQNGYFDLMVMDADGKNQTRLVSGGDNTTPSWSPDGEWIAFARTEVTNPGIYMIRRNGTGLCLIARTRDFPFKLPTWSPSRYANGLYKIVYQDHPTGQPLPDLFAVDARCSTNVPNVPQNLTNTPDLGEGSPAWSQRDVLAAGVDTGSAGSDVYLFDIVPDGAGGIQLATRTNITATGPLALSNVWSPSWTRDGTELIVSASFASSEPDFWILSATGSGDAINVTNTPGIVEWRATWSPDYTYLAFDRDRQAIFRARVTEGAWSLSEVTVLARPPRGYTNLAHPSWRPVP